MSTALPTIQEALFYGDTKPLWDFLKKGGNVEDLEYSDVPLYACPKVVADLELVKLLFERGMKLEDKYSFFGHPIHMSDEVFDWALEKNFDKSKTRFPILYEVACNFYRFKRLIDRGADIRAFFLDLPLVVALAGAGFIEQVELIVSKGVDINTGRENGRTPLIEALVHPYCNIDAIKRLVKLGADYRYRLKDGRTAIMMLAPLVYPEQYDAVNKIKYLMSLYQGWADEVDGDGNTALHLAAKYSNGVDVISLLLNKGFDANLPNKEDKTPIDLCFERNRPELFEPFRRRFKLHQGLVCTVS